MATQLNNWLSIDKTSGTGNAEITLTASSYEELVDRATSLKIQGISANAILNVRQNALVPQIEVEGDLVFSSYGGERTISIKSNIGWRIENGDWYNFSTTQGSANIFVGTTITVDSNGGDERRAEIPIYKNDSDIIIGYITLTQNNANLTVEVPTDIENCFYIEPTVTDGRVIDIQFSRTTESVDVDGVVESYIFYYEDGTWKRFRPATAWNEFPILKIQKRVYFKEFYRRNTYRGWYLKFNITEEVNVGGDLSTLLGDVENPYGYNSKLTDYAAALFEGCPIVNASQLILPTKMDRAAYAHMFRDCRKLIAIPELPSVNLAIGCFAYMFSGCTSLTIAPELPSVNLADNCYAYMFEGCTSLTTAPALPATTLADSCYLGMFNGCKFTTAPALPATTLARTCYQSMFSSCTNLITAPELPATTLAYSCYNSMFANCTFTKAPELPATKLTDYCYYHMFYGCTNLNYIKMLATNFSAAKPLIDWVKNVAPTGTFVKHHDANISIGPSGIPDGWTVETATE